MLTVDEIVSKLELEPHPEGGYYKRVYTNDTKLDSGRATASAIYFLIPKGKATTWHKTDGDELWFWHAGSPLWLLHGLDYKNTVMVMTLGPDIMDGQRPQYMIPANHWQKAQLSPNHEDSPYDWTLVSCVVSPEFQFEGFVLAD